MDVDFDGAKATMGEIGNELELARYHGVPTDGISQAERRARFNTVLSTLDAAKAEIARLHKVIDKDTTSLDDHIASEQRALKEVARLEAELADEKELHIVTDTRRRELTALTKQQDRVIKQTIRIGRSCMQCHVTPCERRNNLANETNSERCIQARMAAAMKAAEEE